MRASWRTQSNWSQANWTQASRGPWPPPRRPETSTSGWAGPGCGESTRTGRLGVDRGKPLDTRSRIGRRSSGSDEPRLNFGPRRRLAVVTGFQRRSSQSESCPTACRTIRRASGWASNESRIRPDRRPRRRRYWGENIADRHPSSGVERGYEGAQDESAPHAGPES